MDNTLFPRLSTGRLLQQLYGNENAEVRLVDLDAQNRRTIRDGILRTQEEVQPSV